MEKKLTYEKLERVSKKLKKEVLVSKKTENMLQILLDDKLDTMRRKEEKLSNILASVTDHMSMIDEQYNIVWTNEAAKELFGPDLVGKKCYSVYQGRVKPCDTCMTTQCFRNEKVPKHDTEIIKVGDDLMLFWCTCGVVERHSNGRPKSVMKIFRDITECKNLVEEQLKLSYDRAIDQAIIYAEELLGQIKERKKTEEALSERKAALKAQSKRLEELNSALKVLLRHRQEDKGEIEEKVLANVKEQILPYVQALRNTRLGPEQMAYIDIVESNLNTIISKFSKKLSSKYLNLTSKEIQIAGLIKDGKTNKDIAKLLNVSVRAIEFHRDNIRTKLSLKNKKVNLRSYLLTLD